MKIVFNTDQIYLHGGIEKVMATKANFFASLPNYEVVIITTEQRKQFACYKLDERIKQVDLNVNYNRKKSYFSRENITKAFRHWYRQKRLLHKLKPDIIISANYNFDHYWLPLIKPRRTNLIKEIHSSGYATLNLRKNANFIQKLKWNFNDYIFSKYDRIVVLNDDEIQYIASANVVVIANSIAIPDDQAILVNKQVIAAGRIAPVKGFDQLIEAWYMVHQEQPEWVLHIYGDNYAETKKALQKQIKSYQLEEVIVFKESVSDLPQTMLDYSIYAMSSISECFPMVLLEAKSVGLPIVSYDCPNGPRHIIQSENDGLLVANQNSNELAAGLLKLMFNNNLRITMGNNAKINSANFATETIMNQWLSLIQRSKKK